MEDFKQTCDELNSVIARECMLQNIEAAVFCVALMLSLAAGVVVLI